MSTSGDAGKKVSLRNAIDAVRRLDELGTARWIEAAAEVVHKSQTGGQPIGKLCPEALTLQGGNVVLDIPMLAAIAYTAPERLRGSSGDRRSDVWSLGVMLWEALAHVRLFEGANDDAVRTAVETAEIVPVNEMNANVPAELGAICTKALQRDPTNRYQSAKAMAAEISAVLDDAGYPEGMEAIEKWIAKEHGTAPAVPSVPVPAPILTPPASKPNNQTMMGIAPFGDPRPPVLPAAAPAAKPTVVDNKTEPLTALDIIESRAQTAKPVEVVPLDNPIIPLATKKPALNDTLVDAKPNKPGALTQGWDIPPEPKPEPAKPVEPPRAKSDSKSPLSSLPAWATRPSTGTQPPPIASAPAPAPTPAFSPSTTLQGISNPAIKPPVIAEPTAAPVLKLPDAPPGATISADKPAASFATTSVVGSSISTAVPSVAPAPFAGNRTATMGSNAIIEAVNASVSAANPPAAPSIPTSPAAYAMAPTPIAGQSLSPPGALGVPAAPVLPQSVVGTPAIKISEAETVNTPAITIPRTPTPQPDIRAVNWDEQAKKDAKPAATAVETPNTAVAKLPPKSDDDFTDKETSSTGSSSALSSGKPRAVSRGDKTGKGDVLAGWGWGTDSHTALGAAADDDGDDSYEADRQKHKKRMMIVFGALGAAALLVVGLAFAFSGDNKKEEEPVAKSTAPIGDPTQAGGGVVAPEPPKQEPPKQEPVAEPPKPEPDPEPSHEPTVAKNELPKPDPAPVPEPKKPDPPKPEPVKLEPKKPDVIAKKPDPPKKPDPVKIEPKKPDPVKIEPKKPDPVAKVDAASAYKTGFQLYVKGDTNGALTSFKEALASNPGYAPTWRGIGLVYEKLGRRSQAVTAFKRYLELSPNAGDAEQIRNRLEKLGS